MVLSVNIFQQVKRTHIIYGTLLAAAFSWPWLATGEAGGTLVDRLSLGLIPFIVIGAIIAYRETKLRGTSYKMGVNLTLATAFLLAWITPAIGIFGRSGDPADLIYFGVLAVGIAGAIISRFQPLGMARTLGAMAISHILVIIFGILAGYGSAVFLNGFFAILWLGSALLFWKATRRQPNRI